MLARILELKMRQQKVHLSPPLIALFASLRDGLNPTVTVTVEDSPSHEGQG
jgi:hypothetical protein